MIISVRIPENEDWIINSLRYYDCNISRICYKELKRVAEKAISEHEVYSDLFNQNE